MTYREGQTTSQPLETEPTGVGAVPYIPRWISATVAVVLAAAIIVFGLTGYVEKWLWMSQVDYVRIFWTVLSVQCAMGVAAFVVVFAFLWFNLHQAVSSGAESLAAVSPWKSALKDADSDANAQAFVKMFPVALKSVFGLVSGVIAKLFAISLLTDFPQLKRDIAIAGDRVVMEPTLDEAMAALIGKHPPNLLGTAAQVSPPELSTGAADMSSARGELDEVEKAAGGGDWTRFGGAMEKLRDMLADPPAVAAHP